MTAPAAPASARALVWRRRRLAMTSFWQQFRRHRGGLAGVVILAAFASIAVLAPVLADRDGLSVTRATGAALAGPSGQFPLGTDENGRSVLTLLIWGAQVSLVVGLAATAISVVLGTLVGIAAGHYRGWRGELFNRLTDWFLVIPFLPLAIVLATVLGASLVNIIVVIGLTSWPGTARLVRAQTLAVEGRPYLERARVLGASDWHQMSRHVLPNVMPLVLAETTLVVAVAILAETTLSFLGLGDPLRPSWGTMLDGAQASGAITGGKWWYVLPPGICVVLVVLAFMLIGRAAEDVLDPRQGPGGGGRR
ncbi:MAG: ABC transporter permease [Kineosporiaceae bacterium]